MSDTERCRCTVSFRPDGEPVINRNGCPPHLDNDPIVRDGQDAPAGVPARERIELFIPNTAPIRPAIPLGQDAIGMSDEIRNALAVIDELTRLMCVFCLQEAANAEAAGITAPPVYPAVLITGGNTMCNIEGRHQVVSAGRAALLGGANGQIPPQMHGG